MNHANINHRKTSAQQRVADLVRQLAAARCHSCELSKRIAEAEVVREEAADKSVQLQHEIEDHLKAHRQLRSLIEAQAQHKDIAQQLELARSGLHEISAEQRKVQLRLATLKQQRAAVTAKRSAAELHALQQQAEEERQALEEHKQLHQQLTSEKASAEERLAREMPELHKLTRNHAQAARQLQAEELEIAALRQSTDTELQSVADALQWVSQQNQQHVGAQATGSSQAASRGCPAVSTAAAPARTGGAKRIRRNAIVESSDSEAEQDHRGCATQQSTLQAAQADGSRRPQSSAAISAADRSKSRAPAPAELQELVAELADEEAALQEQRSKIDTSALEASLDAARRLKVARQELQAVTAEGQGLQQTKAELEEQRYRAFTAAMCQVNAHLSGIYQTLLGAEGDAQCSFNDDPAALFTEGVTLRIRPDTRHYCPFSLLSGGQQAVATLALSFALQASFPSPFYFFDEIDQALDISNASRVAQFIASQSSAQYLVVSHKPQLYEKALSLLGIYTLRGSSAACMLSLPANELCARQN